MKKMSNASRRCHQKAAQLVKESKVRSHKTQPMFPEHERCHKPQRWDTGFGTGEEEQETTGWQSGESLFSLGWPGMGFVARAETLKRVMRVKGSRALSVQGLQQQPEDSVVGGLCKEPREAGGLESKGRV